MLPLGNWIFENVEGLHPLTKFQDPLLRTFDTWSLNDINLHKLFIEEMG